MGDAGIGIGVGMVGAMLLTRVLGTIVFGVVASWTLARRAAGLDPALVLRGD